MASMLPNVPHSKNNSLYQLAEPLTQLSMAIIISTYNWYSVGSRVAKSVLISALMHTAITTSPLMALYLELGKF